MLKEIALVLLLASLPAMAQAPPDEQTILEGDLRARAESWDWFTPPGSLDSAYAWGHGRLRMRLGYRNPKELEALVEVQDVQVVGAPTNAVGPGAIGQMGTGAQVFASSGLSNENTLGIRQAYLKVGDLDKLQFQVGRMEFSSGAEVLPKDPVLAQLVRTRLKDRLIGTFDFSPFGRTFDGARLDGDFGNVHLTGFVAHPTQGGFEPKFFSEINRVVVSDVAVTLENGELLPDGEAQVFWIHYDDEREVPQVDNRPPAVRGSIGATGGDHLDTCGFQLVHKLGGRGDALVWYAHQTGAWGPQTHRADAFTAELGYRFQDDGWKPWLRGGYSFFSGDANPGDNVHGTFVPLLPTIRAYAMMPFYSEMNLQDAFLTLTVKPGDETTARTDLHLLRLADPADLWYAGSGATRNSGSINGFAGRPGGGASSLATVVDLQVDHQLDADNKLTFYVGHAFGGGVVRATYPAHPDATFLFLEYNLRFP